MAQPSRQELLGAAIKAAMDDVGVTPEQLAPIVSASIRTIHRWRGGTGTPDALQLRPMADALGVTPMLFVDPPDLAPYPLESYRLSREEVAIAAARLALLDQQVGEGAGPMPATRRPSQPRKREARARR